MSLGGTIVNRIIKINDIVEVANYLERAKEHYKNLIDEDKEKNEGLRYSEQEYEYRTCHAPEVEYAITFSDNRTIRQNQYEWFIQNIELPEKIIKIEINFNVHFRDKLEGFKHNSFKVFFNQDKVSIHTYSTKLELEANRMIDDIMNLLNNTPERYDITIKNRNLRIQAFCISIGIVLSYIIFILLRFFVEIPEGFSQLLDNKNVLVFGQWIIAAVVGNIIGNGIISGWYKNLVPKTKYAGYDRRNHQSVYVDNIEDYTGHCEVQIGTYAKNQDDRVKIEKVFSVTKKIVGIQVIISILLYLLLK